MLGVIYVIIMILRYRS